MFINIKSLIVSKWFIPFLCGLIGVISFFLLFGYKSLNIFSFDYLFAIKGDLLLQPIGFLSYLYNGIGDSIKEVNKSILFPFFMTDSLIFPDHISIFNTANNLLISPIFKLLAFITGREVQYHGIWVLIVFFLNAFSIACVIQYFTKNKIIIILSTILIFFTYPLFQRVWAHNSLIHHFLIFFSIAYILYFHNTICIIRDIIFWALMIFLSRLFVNFVEKGIEKRA